MGSFRPGYWSELPFPSPGDLPDPRIKLRFPALQADSLSLAPPRKCWERTLEIQELRTEADRGSDDLLTKPPEKPTLICDCSRVIYANWGRPRQTGTPWPSYCGVTCFFQWGLGVCVAYFHNSLQKYYHFNFGYNKVKCKIFFLHLRVSLMLGYCLELSVPDVLAVWP